MGSASTTPLLGAHVSASGGLINAVINAEKLGAGVIQFFGASPRQWFTRIPAPSEIAEYRDALVKSAVKKVYLHGAYLVNLASPSEELRAKSEKNLSEHFMIANALGADGLIFHIGSGQEMPKEEAMKYASEAMRRVVDTVSGPSQLIIENTAGGGKKLGSGPDEVASMMELIGSARIKACFDTQHAFAGGDIEEYTSENIQRVFRAWDEAIGIENIVALHVNDSKTKFNSRHDRHENLGAGFIGLEGFKHLAAYSKLSHAAWILEVPGFAGEGPDLENMAILRSCFAP